MSQENLELVLGLQPRRGLNLGHAMRDEFSWAAMSAILAPILAPDFTCVTHGVPEHDGHVWKGLQGLRTAWLELLTPWESYRTEVEEAIDLGDKVIVLIRDHGRRTSDSPEVALTSAAIWTVRDQRVTRIEFFADPEQARRAVGLEQ